MRVLELYSGIGGMHYALLESGIDHEVVAAADINTTANEIYKENFKSTKIITKCIEAISLTEWNKLCIDMIVMSPPCQPFCRVGKKRDVDDERSKSFLHLLDILPSLKKIPNYILLENVKGFDTSISRERLLETLRSLNFHIQEFLLSPLQCGVPNSRLRYFLIAKRNPLRFNFQTSATLQTEIPSCMDPYLVHKRRNSDDATSSLSDVKASDVFTCQCIMCKDESEPDAKAAKYTDDVSDMRVSSTNAHDDHDACALRQQHDQPLYERYKDICGIVGDYLEKEDDAYYEPYMLPEKLYKRFWVMDLVQSDSRNTCCFTKGYSHHIEGTGSLLEMKPDAGDLSAIKEKRQYTAECHEVVRMRQIRFFTPREIANIMCFPRDFRIPAHLSSKQMYKVLGNSLNVHVVSILLRLLTLGDNIKNSSPS